MELCDRIYVFKDGKNIQELYPKECAEDDLHECMVGRKRDTIFYNETAQIQKPGPEVITVNGLSKKGAFSDISLQVKEREILGIGGLVGCGKNELGLCLAGIAGFDNGEIKIDNHLIKKTSMQYMMKMGLGYVPGDRKNEGIIGYLPINWNLSLPSICDMKVAGLPLMNLKTEYKIARDFISKFRIRVPHIRSLCFGLSGGNQQKVVIAKWVAKNLRVLVLDNPTRGIDVGAKEEVYSILRDLVDQGLSIILITDDLLELIGLSNRTIIMKDKVITWERPAPPDDKPTERELVSYMV
jgi:ribose transport system ATP-binding protein